MATPELPAARLVRTTHTDDGTSVFASDSELTPSLPFGPQASAFTVLDVRSSLPVSNTEPVPGLENTLPRCPPGGVVCFVTDMRPNSSAPMHRTLTLDYAVVLSGEIVLGLDSGEEMTVRAGEFIVQQGVNHDWKNRTDQPCRVLFVMVSSERIKLQNGTVLDETS